MEQQAEEIRTVEQQQPEQQQAALRRRYIQTHPKSRQALKPQAVKKGSPDIVWKPLPNLIRLSIMSSYSAKPEPLWKRLWTKAMKRLRVLSHSKSFTFRQKKICVIEFIGSRILVYSAIDLLWCIV
jgi:hypothetical protein